MGSKRVTVKNIQSAIKEGVGVDILLLRGGGYWYFSSDDREVAIKLASLYTTSVYIYRLTDLSIDRWVNEFMDIWNG